MDMDNNNNIWYWIVGAVSVLVALFALSKKKGCSNSSSDEKPNGMDFTKVKNIELTKDSKENVDLSDVVAYFKGLLGKIKQGEDIPFVAKASKMVEVLPELEIDNAASSLFIATYNEITEDVDNVLILEYKTLGETLSNALSKSNNGIVTLG